RCQNYEVPAEERQSPDAGANCSLRISDGFTIFPATVRFNLGLLMSHTKPSTRNTEMAYQFRSNSYQARPWRADLRCAWWLLCQRSPKVSMATQKLFLEVSPVRNRCVPHMCVAEFTSQVECRPITVRKKMPHIT